MATCAMALSLCAQTEPYLMSDTTVTDCQGELTDTGGPNGPYGNNENLIFTVDADAPLEVSFQGSIEIEPAAPGGAFLFDYLVLYDGPDIGSPVLDTLYGTVDSPPSYATVGALTVQFVSDASAQPQGFHLNWSANPPPPALPVSNLDAPGSCPFSALEWSFTPAIECDLIDWSSLTISAGNGQNWMVDTAAANLISCGSGFAAQLILPLEDGFQIEGNCDIMATLSLGLRDACDSVWIETVSAEWSATGCGAAPDLFAESDTLCTGGCTVLHAIPRGCDSTVVIWSGSDGTSYTGLGPWEVCPSSTTTYSATATESPSGLSGSTTVDITVIDLGAWVEDTTLCPDEVLLLPSSDIAGQWTGAGVSTDPPWFFDASESGAGIHLLEFTATGSAACSSTTEVEVVDIQAPSDLATCPGSLPFDLPSTGGSWSGPGIVEGTFDPLVADSTFGPGPYTVLLEWSGCTAQTQIHVEPLAADIEIGTVCASDGPIPLPMEPPGGAWSGTGWDDASGMWVPEEAGLGPFSLTYTMEGCARDAFGVVLPIEAGPSQTSCPEQLPFIPFANFIPPGGNWSGPGITTVGLSSGEYDPSLVPDAQWNALVYSAPNGCSDTLWMYNRQTAISPQVIHACAGDTDNLIGEGGAEASPWCGTWESEDTGTVEDEGDCLWSAYATAFEIGSNLLTYSVNGCSDTLEVIVYPDTLPLEDWSACISEPDTALPLLPTGTQWNGNGIQYTSTSSWQWSASVAGAGSHPLIWTTPAGCTDTIEAFVEIPPTWSAPFDDDVFCANSTLLLPPGPISNGNGPSPSQENWSLDAAPWPPNVTSAQLGSGTHSAELLWTGNVCTISASWPFEVLAPIHVDLSAGDLTLCPGSGTESTVGLSGGLTADGFELVWSDNGPPLLERTLVPSASSWWWVEVTDGCSTPARDSLFLTLVDPIDAEALFGPLDCHGAPVNLLLDANAPAGVQHVLDGDTLGSGPLTLVLPGGSNADWLLIDPVEGCALDTVLNVPSHPALNAAFTLYPAADCIPWDAQPIGLIDLSQGADAGQWNCALTHVPHDSSVSALSLPWSLGTNPSLELPAPGIWSVSQILTQSNGCADTLVQSLCLLPPTQLWLPEAFSPNGDGTNDALFPRGSGVKSWEMTVTDQWGVSVWQEAHSGFPPGSILDETDPSGSPVGWGGEERTGDRPAPTGVYAVSLSGVTDGGQSILLQQYIRLIR